MKIYIDIDFDIEKKVKNEKISQINTTKDNGQKQSTCL